MAPEILERKLEHLVRYLQDLQAFKGCSFETYQANHYKIDRLLELIATVATDIVFHLLTERGEPPPATYATAFLRAGELGLLPQDLSGRLAKAAGLRNVLAHGYDEIDPAKVHQSIDAVLSDFALFIKALKR